MDGVSSRRWCEQVSRLVQAVVSGRVYATPAAMSPIAETFGALARKFPRQYLRLLSEMPLAFEDSCRLRSPHTRRLQVEVCGSRRFLLDGWWEDHYAASGLNFGFSPRALLAWAHSWTAHLEEEEPHSPPRSRRKHGGGLLTFQPARRSPAVATALASLPATWRSEG